MAKIIPTTDYGDARGFQLETQGPTGSYPARLVDVEDNFNVDVQKYGGAIGEMEKKDVTEFLFAYNVDGQTHLVKSWEMTQSGGERSALFKLLSGMKGEPPVFNGSYDYCDEIGQTCQVTVASKTSKKGKIYNFIASISPLLSELQDKAPKLESVEVPGGRRVELPTAQNDPFKVES
ncbi:hypothetical protein [uncultured Mediterranean phage uvMED]|nr:hypothetical protein [uncultured Mediterranean phage uvMED]